MRGFAIAAVAFVYGCSFEGGSAVIDATPADADANLDAPPLACVGDPRFELINNRRYRVEDENRLGWDDARASCRADGADLAVLKNDSDRQVADTITPASHTWIGLVGDSQFSWRWIDGTLFPVTTGQDGWSNGKPDSGPPDQGCGRLDESGEFDDEPCDNTESFLCLCPR